MKRYTIAYRDSASPPSEDTEGEWVKFDYVQDLIGNIQKESSYLDTVVLESDCIECTCVEELHKRTREITYEEMGKPGYNPEPPYWICPAHGYKWKEEPLVKNIHDHKPQQRSETCEFMGHNCTIILHIKTNLTRSRKEWTLDITSDRKNNYHAILNGLEGSAIENSCDVSFRINKKWYKGRVLFIVSINNVIRVNGSGILYEGNV